MKLFYFIVFFSFLNIAKGQTPILERTLSITLRNQKMSEVLDEIGQKANFTFSYNTNLVNNQQRLDLAVINKSVRQILDQLFKGSIQYKVRGNYLILLKAEAIEQTPKHLFVSGYIIDGKTGAKIPQASIYDQYSYVSAVSNDFGFFKIKLSTKYPTAALKISKQNYVSEALLLELSASDNKEIVLLPLPTTTIVSSSSAQIVATSPQATVPVFVVPKIDSTTKFKPAVQYKILGWLISAKQFVHDDNIRDTLHRQAQFSFLPFMGTNGNLSGKITNNYSLNALVGYSSGVDQLEISGLGSLVHNNVNGVQVAGGVNVVGGNISGVQAAGLLNTDFGKFKGLQAAGIANIVADNVDGVQWAGITNIALKNMKGYQAGALYNGVLGNMQGVQLSGSVNIVGGKLRGWQISPVNIAGVVQKGHQFGLVNFADSSATTPIGLFSFVRRNGYRNLELSTNELTRFNASIRTGMPHFYTIIKLGYEPNVNADPVWSYGVGLGTAISLNKKRRSFLTLEYISSAVNYGQQEDFNQWNHFNILFDLHLAKHISLAFGPTANYFVSNPDYEDYAPLTERIPKRLSFVTESTCIGWYGFHVGLRFK